jgi:hypothetical protein
VDLFVYIFKTLKKKQFNNQQMLRTGIRNQKNVRDELKFVYKLPCNVEVTLQLTVEVTLQLAVGRSVGQSVCQGIEPTLGLVTRYYFLSEGCFLKVAVLSSWGALSDERSGMSLVILSL